MYKQICSLLVLTVFAFPFCGQNKSPQGTAATIKDTGKPKIIMPEGKTPFPYNHSVDAGISDKSGNLWFGSSEGVYRYDGKLFTNYKLIDGLRVDHISRIMQDKAGNVWFGALCGVVRYDAGSSSFSSVKMLAANGINFLTDVKDRIDAPDAKTPVTHVMEDRTGAIWFCAGYNLYRTDGKSNKAISTSVGDFLKSEKLPYHCKYPDDFGISGMYQDKQGNILISTTACSCGPNVTYRLEGSRVNHPCILNKCKHDLHKQQDSVAHYKEIVASFYKMTSQDGKTNIAFSAVLEDKAGNVWLGTDSGVYKYDGTQFIPFTKNDILSKSVVNTIYEDKKGNIWFGTGESSNFHGNGVFRYDPSATAGSTFVTQFTTDDGLCNNGPFKNNIISSITEDNAGKLWVTGDGGASYYNGKSFTSLASKDGFTEEPVKCMVKDKTGSMWFGAWELGLYRYDGRGLFCFTESKTGL